MKEYDVVNRFLAKTRKLLKNNNFKQSNKEALESASSSKPSKPEVSKIKRLGTNQYYNKQGGIQEYTPDHPLYEKPNEPKPEKMLDVAPWHHIELMHRQAEDHRLGSSEPEIANTKTSATLANKRAIDSHLKDLKHHSSTSPNDAAGMFEKINDAHKNINDLRNKLYGHIDESLNSLKSISPKDHKHLYDKHIQPMHAKVGELSEQKLNALRTAYDSLPDGDHKDSVLKSVLQEVKHQKDAWSNKSDFLRSSAGKNLINEVGVRFAPMRTSLQDEESSLQRKLEQNQNPKNIQEINNAIEAVRSKISVLGDRERSAKANARDEISKRGYDWDTELQNHNNAVKSLPQPSPRELQHYKSIADREAEKVRSTWGSVSPNPNEDQRRISEAGAVTGAMLSREDSRTGYRTDAEGIKPVLNRETKEYEMIPVQPQVDKSAGRMGRQVLLPTSQERNEAIKREQNIKNLEATRSASKQRDLLAEQDNISPRNIETERNKKVAQNERETQQLNLNRTLEKLRDEHGKMTERQEKALNALVAKYGDKALSDEEQREFLTNHSQIVNEFSPGINKKMQEIANQEEAIKLHENLTRKLAKSLRAKSTSASNSNKKNKIDLIKRFIKEIALSKNNKSHDAMQYNIFKLLELKNQLNKSLVSNPHLDKLNSLNSKKNEISNKLQNSIKGSPVHRKLTGDLAQADKDIKDHMATPSHEYNAKNAPVGSIAPKPPSTKSTKDKLRAFTEDGVDRPPQSASISSEKWIAPKNLEPELDTEIGQESNEISERRPKSRYEPEEDFSYAADSDKVSIPSDAGARRGSSNLNYEVGIDDSDDSEGGGRSREFSVGTDDDSEITRRAPDESSREYGSQDFELEHHPSWVGLDRMLPDEKRHRPMSQTYEPRMSRERAAKRSYASTSDDKPDYLDYVSGRKSNKIKIS